MTTLITLRRYLVLWTFALAFGGFLFYAGIVVPIGTQVIGATSQGFITSRVTLVLNGLTAAALGLLTWDTVTWSRETRADRLRQRWTLGLIALCAAICCSLWLLHTRLDNLLDRQETSVTDPAQFYALHRVYLWLSTVQWLSSLPISWRWLKQLSSSAPSVNP